MSPGFSFDAGRAGVMADALDATLSLADQQHPTIWDKLGALAIAAALQLARHKPPLDPEVTATHMVSVIVAYVQVLQGPGPPRP